MVKMGKRGFTIAEMLVVIGIAAVLIGTTYRIITVTLEESKLDSAANMIKYDIYYMKKHKNSSSRYLMAFQNVNIIGMGNFDYVVFDDAIGNSPGVPEATEIVRDSFTGNLMAYSFSGIGITGGTNLQKEYAGIYISNASFFNSNMTEKKIIGFDKLGGPQVLKNGANYSNSNSMEDINQNGDNRIEIEGFGKKRVIRISPLTGDIIIED